MALSLRIQDSGQLRPLRVLVTRPLEQALQTAAWIRRHGGEPLVFPCLRVEPCDLTALRHACLELFHYAAIAVTSIHAVRALLPLIPSEMPCPPIFALGHKTAAELVRYGRHAHHIVDGESATASALAEAIVFHLGPSSTGKQVLFPQASEGREELPRLLQNAGIAVTRLAAYQTVAVEPSALHEAVATLRAEAVDLLPIGSPRTAQVLMLALGDDAQRLLSRTLVGAIGQTTTKALRDREIQVDVVAESPSFEDLVSQLALWRQQR